MLKESKSKLLIFIGIVLLLAFAYFIWARYVKTNSNSTAPDPNNIVQYSEPNPDESQPKENNYKVPNNQPRRIIIPSIGVGGMIQRVGKDQNNKVAVPTNINFAGWFVFSSIPGERGVSVIDGHVSGKYAPAIFVNLHKLKVGDKFSVEFGDLSVREFEVINTQSIAETDSTNILFRKIDDVDSQLNLITCGGQYDDETQKYSDRIIVSSKRII